MEAPPEGMSLPSELQFKESQLESNKIGIWTRKQVNKGRLYGPFKGEKRPCTEVLNDTYSWQIVGPKGRRLFCIDASDPTKGNWMRYVKTAPNRELHNLHPVQHKKKIYYKVLKTLGSGTELLCWYDGATDPDIKENNLLPMPVLEKMNPTDNVAYRASRRVPSPLEMQPLGVSEGLEPPLISPAYPNPHTGYASEEPLRHSQIGTGIIESTETIGFSRPLGDATSQDAMVAIQAPDVSSSGELLEDPQGVLDVKNSEKEPVTSSELSGKQAKQRCKKKGKPSKESNKLKKVKKKAAFKPLKDPLRKSVLLTTKTKVKRVRDPSEMVTDLHVIGPDCIITNEEGIEKYRCQICQKLCKYPVGLKIHMRTSHLCVNVQIKGIAKKPWGLGIALKRERDERAALNAAMANTGGTHGVEHGAQSWASVDRSIVQSALDKLKDVPGEGDETVSLDKAGGDKISKVESLSEESAAIGLVSLPVIQGTQEESETGNRAVPMISSGNTETGNETRSPILDQDSKSCDKTVKTPTSSKVNISKQKGKTKKDPLVRKGKNGKDSPAKKRGTNGTDLFAKEESQTIIALSELSISESDQLDSSSKEELSSDDLADATNSPQENTPQSELVNEKQPPVDALPKKEKSSNILPKKFSCPLCHQAFAYRVWMDRHLKMHSDSTTGYSCVVCNLKFSSKKDLSLHRSQHREEKGKCRNTSAVGSQETTAHPFQKTMGEGVDITSGKAKGNDNLAKLVASLQKIQGESSSMPVVSGKVINTEEGVKKRRRGRASATGKKYLCRLCVATFANPSNRSRHMRLIHGITGKKVPPGMKDGEGKSGTSSEQSASESGSGSILTSTDSRSGPSSSTASPFSPTRFFVPILPKKSSSEGEPPPLKIFIKTKTSTPKEKNTSSKKGASPKKARSPQKENYPKKGQSSRKIDVPVLFGYWKNMPRMKVVKNDLKAHVRKQSKKRNIAPYDFVEEFPRTPDIHCPWDGMNRPSPFVPRPRPIPSLGSFVLPDEQPTDLSQNSSVKLPQKKNEDSTEPPVTGPGKVGMSQTRGFLPMDLSNGNYFQYKPESSIGGKTSLRIDGQSSHCTEGQTSHLEVGVSGASPRDIGPPKKLKQCLADIDQEYLKLQITSKLSSKKSSPKCPPVEWCFTCNICASNFSSIRELSTHVVAHAEDYPYKCEFCMHVFPLVDQLQDHKESRHSVKTMYACSVCKKEFAYLSNLENHQVEVHPGVRCTFEDNLSNVVRPQNFTDPTKAFNLRSPPSEAVTRVSYLKEEIDKLKQGISTLEKARDKPPVNTPTKKATPEKGLLFNPQRHHPFEQRRRIGYLSMLSDPRNQKQLGSEVGSNVCTKCLQEFKETSAFHVHIMECASVRGDMLKKGLEYPPNSQSGSGLTKSNTILERSKNEVGKVKKKGGAISRRGRNCSSRQKPGSVAYDPQKYLRAKTVVRSAFDDIHSCAGCEKEFYFINQLERHMKMCPNREKLVNASKSTVALALRKRPRANTLQHKCTNCEKHFTYLGSLEKHLLMCTRGDDSPACQGDTVTGGKSSVGMDSPAVVGTSPNTHVAGGDDSSLSESEVGRQSRKCSMPQRRVSENLL